MSNLPTIIEAQEMVKAFHEKCLPPGITFDDQFGKLLEEVAETYKAHMKKDRRGVSDGLADCLYVLLSLANKAHVNLSWCFVEVHRSNMTKTKDGTLSPKGDGFVPPVLE